MVLFDGCHRPRPQQRAAPAAPAPKIGRWEGHWEGPIANGTGKGRVHGGYTTVVFLATRDAFCLLRCHAFPAFSTLFGYGGHNHARYRVRIP